MGGDQPGEQDRQFKCKYCKKFFDEKKRKNAMKIATSTFGSTNVDCVTRPSCEPIIEIRTKKLIQKKKNSNAKFATSPFVARTKLNATNSAKFTCEMLHDSKKKEK